MSRALGLPSSATKARRRSWPGLSPTFAAATAAALALGAFALAQPINHDESQYVAATALTASGLIPYRDFAYFQTPLQPVLLAPLVMAGGCWAWPALRLANALFGLVTLIAVRGAARSAGAGRGMATTITALMAACDVFLFGVGTARNDALPAAFLALALWIMARAGRRVLSPRAAALLGALLAAAVASKLSYLFPAATAAVIVLTWRRDRLGWLVAGAAPIVAITFAAWMLAPEAFVFEVFRFPVVGPADFYASRPWKMSWTFKFLDTLKFLAIGPALFALGLVAHRTLQTRRTCWLDAMILGSVIAALMPSPTWRQYLLPLLPPLFVRLAILWQERPPARHLRAVASLFAVVGVIPSVTDVAQGFPILRTFREGEALRRALDARGLYGPVMTLAPEYLPAAYRLPDPRFAAGPFYFRSRELLDADDERRLHLLSYRRLPAVAPDAGAAVVDVATSDDAGFPVGINHLLCQLAIGRRSMIAGTRFTVVAATAFRSSGVCTAATACGC